MSFKKNGADPTTARPNIISMGGFNWVVNAALTALGFVPDQDAVKQAEVQRWNHGRSRGKPTPRKRRRNMLIVSKRVRRKHRRARAA